MNELQFARILVFLADNIELSDLDELFPDYTVKEIHNTLRLARQVENDSLRR